MRYWLGLIALFTTVVTAMPLHDPQQQLQLEKYRGQVVIVDFWASWCIPCRYSFPWLNQMQQQYGDKGLTIIGVNVDEDSSNMQRFLQRYPAEFTVIADPQGVLAQANQLQGMPASYWLDRSGKLVYSHIGFRSSEIAELTAKIEQLLATKTTE